MSLDCSLSMTLDTGEAVFASSISEGMTEVIEGNDSLPSLWLEHSLLDVITVPLGQSERSEVRTFAPRCNHGPAFRFG